MVIFKKSVIRLTYNNNYLNLICIHTYNNIYIYQVWIPDKKESSYLKKEKNELKTVMRQKSYCVAPLQKV